MFAQQIHTFGTTANIQWITWVGAKFTVARSVSFNSIIIPSNSTTPVCSHALHVKCMQNGTDQQRNTRQKQAQVAKFRSTQRSIRRFEMRATTWCKYGHLWVSTIKFTATTTQNTTQHAFSSIVDIRAYFRIGITSPYQQCNAICRLVHWSDVFQLWLTVICFILVRREYERETVMSS